MKKLLAILLIALLAMSIAVPVLGHSAPPCNDSGEPGNSDFALHHIIPATANGSHVPGSHHGFSACLNFTGP